jgi:PAS domain S-box-containing protein
MVDAGMPALVDQYDENAPRSGLFWDVIESTSAPHFISDGNRFLYTNPVFEALTGYSREALSSIDPCALFSQAHEGIGLEGRSLVPSRSETRMIAKGGVEKWVALTTSPIEHAHGPAILGALVDLTEFRQREDALKQSEMRYKAVLDFAPDMVIIYSLDGTVIDVSPVGARVWGMSREQAKGLNVPRESWAEEDRARFSEILEETLRRGEHSADVKGVHPDGRHWFAESNAKVARLEDETVIVVIVRDVTERRALEEQLKSALREKEMLLREIHHRVKNNMQIISTLLRLQLGSTEDGKSKALFRESQNRILSMAMIHEKIYQSEGLHRIDLGDYVKDLAREVLASFGEISRRIDLKLAIEDVSFGMDTTIPCGLIIIELLSNSLKHAFPRGEAGEISIGLRSETGGAFELTVSDNGVGLPKGVKINRLKSLGLRLASDLARYQLNAGLEISSGDQGTAFRIRFRDKGRSGEVSG